MITAEYNALLRELQPAAEKRLRTKHSGLNKADRDEVLQDALIQLVKELDTGGVFGTLKGALLTIIDRRAADKARRNKTRAKIETPSGRVQDMAVLSDGRGLSIEDNLFATDLYVALHTLPTEQREAFVLCDMRGLTLYDAAWTLGRSAKTVSAHRELAKENLRKELL